MLEVITESQLAQPLHSSRVPWSTLLRIVSKQLLNIPRVIKCQKTCQVYWVLLLALFDNWGDICFLPVLMHFSWSPWPFKDDWVWSSKDVNKFPQHSMHPDAGLINLWMSSLNRWFLPQSSWTKIKSSFFQVFSLISWVKYSWGLALAVNTVSKGVQYRSLIWSLCWKGPCSTWWQALIFCSIPFATGVLEEAFLSSLTCLATLISNGPWTSSFFPTCWWRIVGSRKGLRKRPSAIH